MLINNNEYNTTATAATTTSDNDGDNDDDDDENDVIADDVYDDENLYTCITAVKQCQASRMRVLFNSLRPSDAYMRR